jgi:hypothetical protein
MIFVPSIGPTQENTAASSTPIIVGKDSTSTDQSWTAMSVTGNAVQAWVWSVQTAGAPEMPVVPCG